MACTSRIVLASALLAFAPTLFAWDATVQEAVARVAQEWVRPGALRISRYLMGPEFNLKDAAGWTDSQTQARPEVEAWRSITIPPNAKKVVLPRDCPVGDCVTAKVRAFEGVVRLAVKDKERRQEAFRFFLNLVVDLHQPLNAGFPPDQGGDRVVLIGGEEIALYDLWESRLFAGADPEELAGRIRALITDEKAERWSQGTLRDWTWETHQAAVHVAYDGVGVDSPQPVDEAYLDRARETAELQLAKAAVRLAFLIERIWP